MSISMEEFGKLNEYDSQMSPTKSKEEKKENKKIYMERYREENLETGKNMDLINGKALVWAGRQSNG